MSVLIPLIGPIEYWWNCPEEPERFDSFPAVSYRLHRDDLSHWLVGHGFLAYHPHKAFRGKWDAKAELVAQAINDMAVQMADVVICMRPDGIPGKGTDRELALAGRFNIPVIHFPPGGDWLWLAEQLESYRDLEVVASSPGA